MSLECRYQHYSYDILSNKQYQVYRVSILDPRHKIRNNLIFWAQMLLLVHMYCTQLLLLLVTRPNPGYTAIRSIRYVYPLVYYVTDYFLGIYLQYYFVNRNR